MTPVFRHGRLRLYLLRLLDEEPRHGYEVIRLLRDRFMGVYAPSPGTIYPRLSRLEDEGLVTHDEENGRKVYRITDAGREELRSRGAELDELEEELSESVSDIAREFGEDVRATVRSLREELTRAAREVRQTERDTAREAAEAARESGPGGAEQARETRDQARETRDQARQAKESAWTQARQAKERARQARDEAFGHAQRLREEATQLRDDARDQFGGWGNWSEWSHWTDTPGPRHSRPRRAPRLRAAGEGLRQRPALGCLGLGQHRRQRGDTGTAGYLRGYVGADPDRGSGAAEQPGPRRIRLLRRMSRSESLNQKS